MSFTTARDIEQKLPASADDGDDHEQRLRNQTFVLSIAKHIAFPLVALTSMIKDQVGDLMSKKLAEH
jgi:hypothetical protein